MAAHTKLPASCDLGKTRMAKLIWYLWYESYKTTIWPVFNSWNRGSRFRKILAISRTPR